MFKWRISKGDIKPEDDEVTNKKVAEEEKMAVDSVERLREALAQADAVVIGAGAGPSTSAGFTYSESVLNSISLFLLIAMVSRICIPAVSILMRR